MKHARVAREVDAPADVVWSLLSRFEYWPMWGPTVRAVASPDDRVAPGVSGRVQTPIGLWLPFVITSVEEGRSWDWEVAGIEATRHVVTPLGEGRTCVELGVSPVFAPYAVVMRTGLRRLAEMAESGGV